MIVTLYPWKQLLSIDGQSPNFSHEMGMATITLQIWGLF
jgi:hypothetical protein